MNSSTIEQSFEETLLQLPGRKGKTFERLKQKDRDLGSCHRNFPSIHIAGTNGKGSVATKIAKVLEHQGLKVGLYTSPHIYSFRERIQINGAWIPKEVGEKFFKIAFDPHLSFFDVLTLMAFLHFSDSDVDIAVIETGLGGTFDATNVITPILSIITSIGYDHMEILGDTLEKIAQEKRGILKPNVPLIVGPTAFPFFPEGETIPREKFYDEENRALAKAALQKLGIDSERGLEIKAPFRFEKIGKILFDPAHNLSAFERLSEALELHYPGKKHPFFLAFSKQKDWVSCLRKIDPLAGSIRMIRSSHPHLREDYPGFKMVEPHEIEEGVVAGSFYILSECVPK